MARLPPLAAAVALALLVAGCAGPVGLPADGPATATLPPVETPAPDGEQVRRVTVVAVVDGDTMDVRLRDGSTERVRLLGVDTPEVHTGVDPAEFVGVPETAAGEEWLRLWARRASGFAARELAGERVTVAVDPAADRRGDYGRLLVHLYDDGELFNLRLLHRGLARVYPTEFARRGQFDATEARAMAAGVGVWGFGGGTPTATVGTDGGAAVRVDRVHADAAGSDRENLEDEYVVLRNDADAAVDMTGWRLQDAAGHTYRFPAGFTLDAGATVTVYSGDGTDAPDALYWGAGAPVWNNDGDTVYLFAADGERVTVRAYP